MDERLAELEEQVRLLELDLRLVIATTRSAFREHGAVNHSERDASQGIAAI